MNLQRSTAVAGDGNTVFTVSDLASLGHCRTLKDLDRVVIETAKLKYRGLLPAALRYAVWAVRPGGRIDVLDGGVEDASSPAFEFSFNAVRQCAARFCARDAEFIDFGAGTIQMRRRSPILEAGWGAGVVFSGRDEEIPQLLACLDGLQRQPELAVSRGGEIVVCGPARNLDFLRDRPLVRYLVHELPDGPRVMICQKKNALIRSIMGPRVVILHSRIVLDEGCLAAVPREFDMASPNTSVLQAGKRVPYLSLCQSEAAIPGRMPRTVGRTMRSVPDGNPLHLHQHAPLFVDGGAFFVTRSLHHVCPLDDDIAWQEAEDLDWCMRAYAQGYLIDLAPDATAISATSKLRSLPALGPLTWPAVQGHRARQLMRARLHHVSETLRGRR